MNRIAQIKAAILSFVEPLPKLPTEHEIVIRAVQSMLLFERDGTLHFDKWREWWHANPEKAAALLDEFRRGL